MTTTTIRRDCVIVGGGPANMVLGYLLAKAGLSVTVFRSTPTSCVTSEETPSTPTIAHLGVLGRRDEFLALPLSRITTMDAVLDGTRLTMVDFDALQKPDNLLVFAHQWDFLNFITEQGRELPGFERRMSTSGTELLTDDGRVVGVRAAGSSGDIDILAPLTVAVDGRNATLRDSAGMQPEEFGTPIDVLWFHLPKPENAPPTRLAYGSTKGMVLTIDRGDYYRMGAIIPTGGFDELQGASRSTPATRCRTRR